jgi:hypothetical protein
VDQTVVDGALSAEQRRPRLPRAQTVQIFDIAVVDDFDCRGPPPIEAKGALKPPARADVARRSQRKIFRNFSTPDGNVCDHVGLSLHN